MRFVDNILPEHGEHDQKLNKWCCSYWMTEDEWMDVHGYFPASKSGAEKEKDDDILEEQM